jgi:hypothetical protein
MRRRDIDDARPCHGATEVEHSYIFTADGRFGSYDQNGGQVDHGDYTILDDATLTFPTHERELGGHSESPPSRRALGHYGWTAGADIGRRKPHTDPRKRPGISSGRLAGARVCSRVSGYARGRESVARPVGRIPVPKRPCAIGPKVPSGQRHDSASVPAAREEPDVRQREWLGRAALSSDQR